MLLSIFFNRLRKTELEKEIEKDLSNNTDKRNPKSENKQVIKKNNDTKT